MYDGTQNAPTVIFEDSMGSDLTVVNAAKVSHGNRSEWAGSDEFGPFLHHGDKRLIWYLARGMSNGNYDRMIAELVRISNTDEPEYADIIAILEGYRGTPIHKSPFNHAMASFTCKAPIYVARQLVKHEYLVWNEISGRYVEFEADFNVPEYRSKAADKKQGSGNILPERIQWKLQSSTQRLHQQAYTQYKYLLSQHVCEEQARGVLPLDTMTQWRWTGSLGAFAKMCSARLRSDTQEETRDVAKGIDIFMGQLFPISWRALVHAEYEL